MWKIKLRKGWLNFKYAVAIVLNPLAIFRKCDLWDDKLNELLDKYSETASVTSYYLNLGNTLVTIGGAITVYGSISLIDQIPNRKTVIRLALLVDKLRKEQKVEEVEKYKTKLSNIK